MFKGKVKKRKVEYHWVSMLQKIEAIEYEINRNGAVKDFGLYEENSDWTGSDVESDDSSEEELLIDDSSQQDELNEGILEPSEPTEAESLEPKSQMVEKKDVVKSAIVDEVDDSDMPG